MEKVKIWSGTNEIDIEIYTEIKCKEMLFYTLERIIKTRNYIEVEEYFNGICNFWQKYQSVSNAEKFKMLKVFTREFEELIIFDTYNDAGYSINFDIFAESKKAMASVLAESKKEMASVLAEY